MWDRGGLHAIDDDEKMGEDKEETDNEDVGVEEQEEEHQKARAIAGPDLPSRREVEYHILTHIPFRSWCNHCLGGRERRSAHKRRHCEGEGVDDRAVTTYSIDYMYLTEEDKAEERDGAARTARGSTTLGRPIIVGVDRKTGGVRAHRGKCKGSGDPWIATRIAAGTGELGDGGSRVVLKADQEVAIADVHREVVTAPWANRRATAESRTQFGE